jgi:hypothetical protein
VFGFRISTFVLLLVAGCASPGQPIERKPLVPQAVKDLAAVQSGNDVILTFTLPSETVDHRPLEQAPAIEIYRDFQLLLGADEIHPQVPANPTLLVTIPSAMVDRYATQRHIRYADPIPAIIYAANVERKPVYVVRTRASSKTASANSNPVALRPFPMPDPISDLKAEVTQSAVVLTWTPPQKDPTGAAPAIAGYHLYRQENEPGTTAETKPSPVIGEPDAASTSFSDSNFEFGKTYTYLIRSVVQTPNGPLESADSNVLVVTPKDVFPPAAPLGLVVAVVLAQGGTPAHLELSWAISPETDVAGYNIYRSEQAGAPGTRLNNELLLAPAFSDMNIQPGRRYFYSVTAVDRSGNESPKSAVVSGGVPAEGQPTP